MTIRENKKLEAAKFLSDEKQSAADYPLIYTEIGATGETAYQVAQVFANMAAIGE